MMHRQHLIDPEICIRCNTCEETCPNGAIQHNDDNYVVSFDVCNHCGSCLGPCPTGAIQNWRDVETPYTVDAQFGWLSLPAAPQPSELPNAPEPASPPEEIAPANLVVKPAAPASASRPSVNLFRRDRPAVARIVRNERLTADESGADIRHLVLRVESGDFPVLEGQSIGIVMPGTDPNGKRHAVRQYSVASSRDGEAGERNTVALTVKRVPGGRCSSYLCDLQPGDSVEVTGPFGATFLMPEDPRANLLMVGTGTGVAPFRGFMERRRRAMPGASGAAELFLGAQSPQAMPYLDYLEAWPAQALVRELCFSRLDGQPRTYVQDRIRARGRRIAALLRDERTHLFLCGLKGMEHGVEEALGDACAAAEMSWRELAAAMRAAGRFHVETY